jgi:hypothetical protein
MMYFGPKKSAFAIKYKVQARMEENLDSSQSTIKPLRAKQGIYVQQPILDAPKKQVISVEKNVKTFFFVKQGPTKIDIDMDREGWYSNEKAVLTCSIDNTRCDKHIKLIKVKVRRVLRCSS